jgi:hypothetical protein
MRFDARIGGPRWTGVARLDRGLLPPPPHRVNAFAVHGTGGARRHLACFPAPGPAPDFHRLESFAAFEIPEISSTTPGPRTSPGC